LNATTPHVYNLERLLLMLSLELGLRAPGVFVEAGGNNGLVTNTLYLEACLHWRGVLIEPIHTSFQAMLQSRPGAMSIRAAACQSQGTISMLRRNSVDADVTAGFESVLTRHHPRWKPHKWVRNKSMVKHELVPCAPLSDMLAVGRVRRVDIFVLDVEGSELVALRTINWQMTSIGIMAVEFSAPQNHASVDRLEAIHGILTQSAGFEFVACLEQYAGHIYDFIFVRPDHFGSNGPGTARAAFDAMEVRRFCGSACGRARAMPECEALVLHQVNASRRACGRWAARIKYA
jgi:FkbM family methyltransferase